MRGLSAETTGMIGTDENARRAGGVTSKETKKTNLTFRKIVLITPLRVGLNSPKHPRPRSLAVEAGVSGIALQSEEKNRWVAPLVAMVRPGGPSHARGHEDLIGVRSLAPREREADRRDQIKLCPSTTPQNNELSENNNAHIQNIQPFGESATNDHLLVGDTGPPM
ncbi:hypothetical protein EDB83DRAFT_2318177 [Lactarius deliciosus]|nr:hypothetical protein EDB83DRAFT_2318177 [Lactarius deliciosus]